MPAYFILGKFTAEGLELLVRDRTEESKHREALTIDDVAGEIATDVGVELVGCWITAGVYDALLQLEAPGAATRSPSRSPWAPRSGCARRRSPPTRATAASWTRRAAPPTRATSASTATRATRGGATAAGRRREADASRVQVSEAAVRSSWEVQRPLPSAARKDRHVARPLRPAHPARGQRPGDGPRFKGRGYIQITGRANYAALGRALRHDFVGRPHDLAQPHWAAQASCRWWRDHGCNAIADSGDFVALTRRINGGETGLRDREVLHARARQVAARLVPRGA